MKLNYKRTFMVGFAFFSITAFWQLYDHCIPLILRNTFNVGDGMSGVIMALDNVVSLFLLPFFGALSDKTKTKFGRRKPYIIVGSIGAAISMFLIPIADKSESLLLFSVVLALVLLFMGSYRSPAVALMPDVTIPPLRSKANAIINLMGAAGGVAILASIATLLPSKASFEGGAYRPDYTLIFAVCSALILLATLIVFFFVNENKLVEEMHQEAEEFGIDLQLKDDPNTGKPIKMAPDQFKSFAFLIASIILWFFGYNAVITSFSKYCDVVLNFGASESASVLLIANIAAILSYIPVGIISSKVGRKKTILFGIVMLTITFAISSTIREASGLLYVLFAMAGISWASINVNSYPMVAGMAPGGNVGKFTGYYYTASMGAQILTPIVSGFMIEIIGKFTTIQQGYMYLLPYGALFVGLSFITMLFVRHGDDRPTPVKSALETFEAMDD